MADPTVRNLIFGVAAISLLGVMLLLGVLIGKDDNQTVAAAPATTTTAAAPTETSATETTADAIKKDKGAGADKAAKSAGEGVAGGSGSTEGISTNNPLDGLTGDALVEAQKNAPDVVATGGEAEALDPGPAGGGEGGGTCIGC